MGGGLYLESSYVAKDDRLYPQGSSTQLHVITAYVSQKGKLNNSQDSLDFLYVKLAFLLCFLSFREGVISFLMILFFVF